MTQTLIHYAAQHNYVMAAAFGPDCERQHWYFVSRDIPDSAAIVRDIRTVSYAWLGREGRVPNWTETQIALCEQQFQTPSNAPAQPGHP